MYMQQPSPEQASQVKVFLEYVKNELSLLPIVSIEGAKLIDYTPKPVSAEATGGVSLEQIIREGKVLCLKVKHTEEYPMLEIRTDHPEGNSAFCIISDTYEDTIMRAISKYEQDVKNPLQIDVQVENLGTYQKIAVNGKERIKRIG